MKAHILTDDQFRIVKISESILEKTGISKNEVTDKLIYSLFALPKEIDGAKKLSDFFTISTKPKAFIVYSQKLSNMFFIFEKCQIPSNFTKIYVNPLNLGSTDTFVTKLSAKLFLQLWPENSILTDLRGNVVMSKIRNHQLNNTIQQLLCNRLKANIFSNNHFISQINKNESFLFPLQPGISSKFISISPVFNKSNKMIGFMLMLTESENNELSKLDELKSVPFVKINNDFKSSYSQSLDSIFKNDANIDSMLASLSFKELITNCRQSKKVQDENFFFNGKLYHLTIVPFEANTIIYFSDITFIKDNNPELEHNLEQQDLVTQVSLILNSAGDIAERINQTLKLIGEHKQVSRAYIFQNSNDGMFTSNTYEWCNLEVNPEIDNLKNIPLEVFPDWNKLLDTKGMFVSNKINELPKDIRGIFEPQGIKSIIILPIYKNLQVHGFIGFDDCKIKRNWTRSELSLLKTVSQLTGNVFEKEEFDDGMKKINKDLKWKNLSLKHYAFKLSHNLRNPLSTILNAVRLLNLSTDKTPNEALIYDSINQSAAQLDSSITELSLLAGHEISINDSLTKINVHESFKELLSRIIILSDCNPQISIEIERHCNPIIFTNETLIYNVFTLVLFNTIKHSDKNKRNEIVLKISQSANNNINVIIDFKLAETKEADEWLNKLSNENNILEQNDHIENHLIKEYISELGAKMKFKQKKDHNQIAIELKNGR